MSKIIKKKIKIEGMHCSSCAMNIDFDLEDLNGVQASKTNYARHESEVEFDEEVITDKEIIEQVKKTGYQAKIT